MNLSRRRCRTCGQHTHPKGQLPAGCLVDELVHHHVEGTANGPGLYVQLLAALGDPARRDPGAPSSHQKPGSRPPGWRADIADLLRDIDRTTRKRLTPQQRDLLDRHEQECRHRFDDLGYPSHLRYAPTRLVCTPRTHALRATRMLEHREELREDLEQWRLQARQALGFVTPSVLLDQVACYRNVREYVNGGWVDRQIGCGQVSLRVARDAMSDVWCGSSQCHDDAQYPDCRDLESPVDALDYDIGLGYAPAPLTCRRTDRDLRHAIRWDRKTWHRLWAGEMAA